MSEEMIELPELDKASELLVFRDGMYTYASVAAFREEAERLLTTALRERNLLAECCNLDIKGGAGVISKALEARDAALRESAEKDKRIAEAEAESAKSKRAREHTWKWVASHYGKLEDWARKRLPEPWRNEFFSCIANGTWGHKDVGERYTCNAGFEVVPSGYIHMDDAKGQLVLDQTKRAEDAEIRAESAESELTTLRERVSRKDEVLKEVLQLECPHVAEAGPTHCVTGELREQLVQLAALTPSDTTQEGK